MMLSRRHAFFLMLLVPLLWSMAGIFTRQLSSIKNVEIVFWRSLFVSVFVAIFLLITKREKFLQQFRDLDIHGLLSSVMWGIIFTCFMLSLTLTKVANTLIVDSCTPLLTAFLAWLFLKQKIQFRTWLAIIFAFLGLVWIFIGNIRASHGTDLAGMLFALAVPFSYAINFMIFNKSGKRIDLMPAVCLGGIFSFFAMIPLAYPFHASVNDITILAAMGIFQLGVPCLLLIYISRFLPPAEIALLAMLEIILGPLWVWLGINEIPSKETILGGSVVLLCLLFHEIASLLQNRYSNAKKMIYEKKQ